MKITIYLSTILLLCFSCKEKVNTPTSETILVTDSISYSDSIKGNFNGNNKNVYAWYVSKADKWVIEDKDPNKCYNYIEFSDSSIPRLLTNYWLAPKFVNEGDLNNDGKDEIGTIVMTDPNMGTWHEYHVWTLQNGKWEDLIEPFNVFIGSDLEMDDLVKIDSTDNRKVVIRYNEWKDEEGAITKEKKVKMKF